MVPGNVDEAANVEVDEEHEEEPPNMLNGTALGCLWFLQMCHPSIDPHFAFPPSSTLPASMSPFIHVELFFLPCHKQMTLAFFIQFHAVCCISFPLYRMFDRLT